MVYCLQEIARWPSDGAAATAIEFQWFACDCTVLADWDCNLVTLSRGLASSLLCARLVMAMSVN